MNDELPAVPDDDESTFDVDAWLTEARPPQRAVTVYGRGDLLSALQALESEPDPPGEVMGGSPKVKAMRRLREELDASRRTIHVRGLLNKEREDLLKTHGGGPDAKEEDFDGYGYEVDGLARAAVEPTLTPAQARKLHDALGEAQWQSIWQAINQATSEPIDVPLSRLGSGSTEGS